MSRVDLDAVFGDLVDARRWVAWREEGRKGKTTKPPYSPVTGRYAASTDPATWATLEEALTYAERSEMDGVGIVLGGGLGGADLDACRDPETGEIEPWAQKWIKIFDSYTEVSPSGTGVKILAYGAPNELPASKIRMGDAALNGRRPQIEVYTDKRYFTVTGNLVDGCSDEIQDCGELGGAWDRMVRLLCDRSNRTGTNLDRPPSPPGDGLPDDVNEMLAVLSADCPHDEWLRVGMALHHSDPDGGLSLWDEWSATEPDRYPGEKEIRRRWASFHADREKAVTIGTLVHMARTQGYRPLRRHADWGEVPADGESEVNRTSRHASEGTKDGGDAKTINEDARRVSLDDFYAYMPEHKYIFVPTRELWPVASVNARLPTVTVGKTELKAGAWLDQKRPVEQMTWAPGEDLLIEDRLVSNGGWIKRPGCSCFNLYRPPSVCLGRPESARLWIDLIEQVFPDDAKHIVRYLAHRVQKPSEKPNHALVLGGLQGIGKDTILEPVKHAVGAWNFAEVSPAQLTGRFNGFVKSVILRVSEARDLGDIDRYGFYEHMKAYTAAPPDVLRCDEKNIREYYVFNVCGVVLTTNHKSAGIYLPADDRRHYVAWSELTKDDFTPDYWTKLWAWYQREGHGHIAAYLADLDISDFDAKAPPPKTPAFWDIVDANRAPEDADLADVLDRLGHPAATTIMAIGERAEPGFGAWLRDRKNRRQIPHRLEAADYGSVRNESAKDGLWVVDGRRQVIYARRDLSLRDRRIAALTFAGQSP